MKMKSSHELSAEQISFVKGVMRDPVLFANHVLGVSLWEREAEILQSIKSRRRTAVKACHGVGKTFTLAIATLWWLARHREGIVLTTSPTQRQVRTQLWSEIHRAVERARVPYPKLKTTELKFRDDNNFALGFSTNQAENFQGYHGKQVLIIADEAPGIESGIWDAVAGTMAGGEVHIVMAGNPTVPSGAFFDAFTKERGLWNCFTISAFDSPNLIGLELEQLLRLDLLRAGRSIATSFHTWLRSVGPTSSTLPGGTVVKAARRTGWHGCWRGFRTRRRTRSSRWSGWSGPSSARSKPQSMMPRLRPWSPEWMSAEEKRKPSRTCVNASTIDARSSGWGSGAVRTPAGRSSISSTNSVLVSAWCGWTRLVWATISASTCATAVSRSRWSMSASHARAGPEKTIQPGAS
jgi:hypothetical protein